MYESGIYGAEYRSKVARERKFLGVIISMVNARGFQLEYPRLPHKTLLSPVLLYGSETMVWKQKERSQIGAVQMDNLRSLLGIR